MADEFPVFDHEWVSAARHREASVAELERRVRTRRRARRRRRLRSVLAGTAAIAAVAGIAVYLIATSPQAPGQARAGDGVDDRIDGPSRWWVATVSGERPPPSRGEGERLMREVAPGDPTAPHAFLHVRGDGTPVSWDPCRPVRFVVNPQHAPPDPLELVDDALATVTAASGLRLVLDGATDEAPTTGRPAYQPDRYGDEWAPVLIAWTDDTVIADLAGAVAGIGGGSSIADVPSEPWYVSGILYLDRDLGDHPDHNRLVMLHELGHVLGLDHVADPTQVMNPVAGAAELGPGDLAGLARLGAGGCAGEL